MSKIVQLNTLDTQAADPASVKADLVFDVSRTQAATAQSREHWEGYGDTARTVRVIAYIPAELDDKSIKLTMVDKLRCTNAAPLGSKFENGGKTRAIHLEDKDLGVFMIVRVPVAVQGLASVTVVRG